MRVSPTGSPDDWFAWLAGNGGPRRKRATLIIGGLEPRDRVPVAPFVAPLSSPEEDVVFWALVGLARIGRRAAPALRGIGQIALRHPAFGIRQQAVNALPRIAPSDPRTIRILRKAFADDSPFVRREALQAAIDVKDLSSADLKHIAAMGNDPDEGVASWSEIALRNIRIRARRREARLRRLASKASAG